MSEYLLKKYLAHDKPVTNTATLFYTAPTGSAVIIESIFVNNMDFQNNPDHVSIRVVKHLQTAADDNCILNNYEINAGENILKDKIILESGDFITIRSENGTSTFLLFGQQDKRASLIGSYKDEVAGGDFAHATELALLTGGAVQNNTNSCP